MEVASCNVVSRKVLIDRLRKRADFKRLATSSQIISNLAPNNVGSVSKIIKSKSFIMQYAPFSSGFSKESPLARYGLTITKKVGNAVKRNRLRRRLRAIIVQLFPSLAIPFYDYVFIGRESGLHQDFLLLQEEITKALGKAQQNALLISKS